MSRTKPTTAELATMRVACEFCGASPGVWCISHIDPEDRPARLLHRARVRDAGVTYPLPPPTPRRTVRDMGDLLVERPELAALPAPGVVLREAVMSA